MKPLIIEGVFKDFGGLRALHNINLEMEPGERRVLIGPNGAGKTTLFNIISGTFSPSEGRIFIFGKDVTKKPPYKRMALGLGRTFQITNVFLNLTVEENIMLSLMPVDPPKHVFLKPLTTCRHLFSHVDKLLEQSNLRHRLNVPVCSLSYGEQRQVEIIMTLSQNPKLLLLDEPTSGLSAEEIATLTSMLKSLPKDISFLLIAHDMDVAFDLGDWFTVLHMGRILADGPRDQVKENAKVQEVYLGAQQ